VRGDMDNALIGDSVVYIGHANILASVVSGVPVGSSDDTHTQSRFFNATMISLAHAPRTPERLLRNSVIEYGEIMLVHASEIHLTPRSYI